MESAASYDSAYPCSAMPYDKFVGCLDAFAEDCDDFDDSEYVDYMLTRLDESLWEEYLIKEGFHGTIAEYEERMLECMP